MYLNGRFNEFFKKVNPSDDAIARAKRNHEDVRAFLASTDGLGTVFATSLLAGSYERRTAIDPIKDVDVICVLKKKDTDDPLAVLRQLRAALKRKYDKTDDETANQRRSVRVEVDGFQMDIIPAIAPNGTGAPLKIPDRALKKWIDTNPLGHVELTRKRNADSAEIDSQHLYVPTVKLLRWWKTRQLTAPHPKGFLIEVLTYQLMPTAADYWSEGLRATMDAIAATYGKYRGASAPPTFADPAMPGQVIGTKLTAAEFTAFLDKIDESRGWLKDAIAEKDEAAAAKLYCKVFLDGFPCSDGGPGARKAAVFTGARDIREARPFA